MDTRVFDLIKDFGMQAGKVSAVPYPFETRADLLQQGKLNGLRIAAMMRANARVHEDEYADGASGAPVMHRVVLKHAAR